MKTSSNRLRLAFLAVLGVWCSGTLVGCILGPADESKPAVSFIAPTFQAQVDLSPAVPGPGTPVELQVYAVLDGDSPLMADVSLNIRSSDGDQVHEKPWNGLAFDPGQGWLLSSSFFMDADSAEAPYSARVFIRGTDDGTVYFDGQVLSFGDGQPAHRVTDES